MATLNVSKEKGGTGRPSGMTVVPPSQEVPLEALQSIGKDAGLDGVALADFISAMAMHDRHATNFFRAAAIQTTAADRRKIHESLVKLYTSRVTTLQSPDADAPAEAISGGQFCAHWPLQLDLAAASRSKV